LNENTTYKTPTIVCLEQHRAHQNFPLLYWSLFGALFFILFRFRAKKTHSGNLPIAEQPEKAFRPFLFSPKVIEKKSSNQELPGEG
jgi:hypothetical protein